MQPESKEMLASQERTPESKESSSKRQRSLAFFKFLSVVREEGRAFAFSEEQIQKWAKLRWSHMSEAEKSEFEIQTERKMEANGAKRSRDVNPSNIPKSNGLEDVEKEYFRVKKTPYRKERQTENVPNADESKKADEQKPMSKPERKTESEKE